MSSTLQRNLARLLRYTERGRQALNIEARRLRRDYAALRTRYYSDYWQRTAEAMGAELEELGGRWLRIRRGDALTYVNGFEMQIDDHVLLSIAGDKALSQRLIADIDLPVPRHLAFDLGEIETAQRFLSQLGRPVVVKPVDGAGGRGVTTGIEDDTALRRATFAAARAGTRFLVEEQLPGDNYRFLYLAGELIDVIRRDPPTVIGDGRHDIRTLIALENQMRLGGPPYTGLSALTCDPGVDNHLSAQGLSVKSVPAEEQRIEVKGAVNQNGSRDNHQLLAGVHASYHALGRQVQSVLDVQLLGIDVICPDVGVSLADSGGGINEINTTPALHHHDLIAERGRACPVGQLALDYIFSQRPRAPATSPKSIVNG